MADKKTISVSVSTEIRVTYRLPYANAIPDTFSVTGNLDSKEMSYPLIAAYFRRKYKEQIEVESIKVENYIPSEINLKEFREHCKVSFLPSHNAIEEGTKTVMLDLEQVDCYSYSTAADTTN